MLQPWEQDQLETLTLEQMIKDDNEISKEVYTLWHVFIGNDKIIIPEKLKEYRNWQKELQVETFKNNKHNWTILEEALKLQKIIEMYLEFIVESGEFSSFSDSLTTYLEKIDDVLVVLQKFYKKLEEKFAEKLILEN